MTSSASSGEATAAAIAQGSHVVSRVDVRRADPKLRRYQSKSMSALSPFRECRSCARPAPHICTGQNRELTALYRALRLFASTTQRRAYGSVSEERALRARVLALNLCAVLARYGAEEGMTDVRDEALAGYARASRAL